MAVPTQHPAVVLRSHYTQVRVLLAIAMVAIVSLTVAVVILAGSAGSAGTTAPSAAEFSVPSHARDHGGAPVPDLRAARSQRYDGGPEEGSR